MLLEALGEKDFLSVHNDLNWHYSIQLVGCSCADSEFGTSRRLEERCTPFRGDDVMTNWSSRRAHCTVDEPLHRRIIEDGVHDIEKAYLVLLRHFEIYLAGIQPTHENMFWNQYHPTNCGGNQCVFAAAGRPRGGRF